MLLLGLLLSVSPRVNQELGLGVDGICVEMLHKAWNRLFREEAGDRHSVSSVLSKGKAPSRMKVGFLRRGKRL